MSITSCFRYVLELPATALNTMLAAIIQEADAAGVQTSIHMPGVPVGIYTATVDAQVNTAHPPTIDLTATNLGATLHVQMKLQVQVNELPDLNRIEYQVNFDLPGEFRKVTPATGNPVLNLVFPNVTGSSLNLAVQGGQVPVTAALIEPRVHALYAAHPELAHNLQPGVATPLPSPDETWAVTVDLYDDAPGAMPFRGRIQVAVLDPTHIRVDFPGHLRAQNITPTLRIDSDIVVHVTIGVQQTDGQIVAAMSQVTQADVAIDFAAPNFYTIGGSGLIRQQFATRIAALGDLVQTTPTHAQVQTAITTALVSYGTGLTIPVLRPTPPVNSGDMDLTSFVPVTLGSQVLALQIEPQPVPCDTLDNFAGASGFAVSVDAEKVNSIIAPVVAAENGRSRNIQGHDVDIHDISVSLADPGENGVAAGHLWLTGKATIHIDCWPDSHIEFRGPLTLTPDRQTDGTYRFQPVAGQFSADDPCCASADPNQIAQLIQGDTYPPFGGLPQNFSGVGQVNIQLTSVDISRAGFVLRGTLAVATAHSLHAGQIQHNTYWSTDHSGGG